MMMILSCVVITLLLSEIMCEAVTSYPPTPKSSSRNIQRTKRTVTLSPRAMLSNAWPTLIPEAGYDDTLAPSYSLPVLDGEVVPGSPWIRVQILPHYVTQISMKNMDYQVDITSTLEWEDDRLNNKSFPKELRIVDVPASCIDQLWTPKVHFAGKGSDPNVGNMHELKFKPRIKQFIVRKRQTIVFICVYSFKYYPFDIQQCAIEIVFEHTREQYVTMNALAIEDFSKVHMPPEFTLMDLKLSKCSNQTVLNSFNQRCKYIISFHRIYTQHILLIFTPSTLIVVLSWIAFLLPIDTAAPRVALGLTTLLTLITQLNAAQKDLPAVAEVKALDVWMFMCITMVFAALLEFSISYIYYTFKKANSDKNEVIEIHNRFPKYVNVVGFNKGKLLKKENSTQFRKKKNPVMLLLCPSHSNMIDGVARILFPLVFLIFNIIFWNYYLAHPKF